MKKVFSLFLLIAAVSTSIFAQKAKPATSAPDLFETEIDVYRNALKYYDIQSATAALYTALAVKPDRSDLKDTLAMLYFASERYMQAN
ncbi:MAG TPA: hypothetical protein VGB95_05275, partial [Chitinophagales bacterium]